VIDRRTDEVEDEARIVVDKIGIRVLDAPDALLRVHHRLFARDVFHRQQTRPRSEQVAYQPVEPGADVQQQLTLAKAAFEIGEKADFTHGGWVRANQAIARHTQLAHQGELEALEILDATPDQVRALLAGQTAEIAAIDQGDLGALGRQGRGADSPVDPAAHDQNVERASIELVQIAIA
jgi:hypothetical protein